MAPCSRFKLSSLLSLLFISDYSFCFNVYWTKHSCMYCCWLVWCNYFNVTIAFVVSFFFLYHLLKLTICSCLLKGDCLTLGISFCGVSDTTSYCLSYLCRDMFVRKRKLGDEGKIINNKKTMIFYVNDKISNNVCFLYFVQSGKIITFLYSIIMAAVFIGLLERTAKEIIGITSDIGENFSDSTEISTIPSGGKTKTT